MESPSRRTALQRVLQLACAAVECEKLMKKLLPAALLLMLTATGVHADDSDAVEYRKHIMSTMDEELASIDMVLANRAPAAALAAHARILAITAGTVKKAFESNTPGGDAKPDVWANWADFVSHLDALTAAAGQLAQADPAAAAGLKVNVATACKNCHDQYRVPKK